jgi:four helix bundle protein
MKQDNVIQIKSYNFAVKVVKLYQYLVEEKREYVLSKQLLRCGTSVGANVEEAIGGQSKKDFIAKLSISYKEAREAHFWIRLLYDTSYISLEQKQQYLSDIDEVLRILAQILKTAKG